MDYDEKHYPPEFHPAPLQDRFKTESAKQDVHNQAYAAGLETKEESEAAIEKSNATGMKVLQVTQKNYGGKALSQGSIKDRHDREQIFRNASGKEAPGDRAVIETMVAARGQVLDDEQ